MRKPIIKIDPCSLSKNDNFIPRFLRFTFLKNSALFKANRFNIYRVVQILSSLLIMSIKIKT